MELIRKIALLSICLVLHAQQGSASAVNQQVCNSYSGLIKSFGFNHDWQFLESSGSTAADSISGNTGTYQNSPVLSGAGPLVQPSRSIGLNGSNQYVSLTSSYVYPINFTLLAWFKTSSTIGGGLVGFTDLQNDDANYSWDRALWIMDNGVVVFSVYNDQGAGGQQALSSNSTGYAYNDGNWHLAVATMDSTSAGQKLYIDGALVDTNSNTVSQNYTGYWHLGYATSYQWPNAPSSDHFTGQLGEVAISDTVAMTQAQVQELYSIGTKCSGVYTAPTMPSPTFTLSPASLSSTTYVCTPVTVTSNYLATSGNIVANIAHSGSFVAFSDQYCTNPTTTATILPGTNSATFYVQDTVVETATITLSATSYNSPSMTSTTTGAPSFLWTGGGGNANWTTAANWSGGVVPGSNDTAIFGACSSNCSPTINTSISINAIEMHYNYTGTITQAAGSVITINATGYFVQSGGNFVGGNSSIGQPIGQDFIINAGTFKSTSSSLYASTWQVNGGTFIANGGTLNLAYTSGGTTIIPSAATYANVTFSGNQGLDLGGATWTIAGNVSMTGGGPQLNNGTLNIAGNLSCTGIGFTGSGVFNLTGNAAGQTVTGVTACFIPHLTITAGTHPVTLSGIIETYNGYTFNSASALTTTGSTLQIDSVNALIPGPYTYNNVTLVSWHGGEGADMGGGTMSISGNLWFYGGVGNNPDLDNGTFAVSGNVTAQNEGYNSDTQSVSVKLVGNPAGQTVSTVDAVSTIPGLEIATGTYPVTLGTYVAVGDSPFKMTSVGTFTVTGSTLYLQSFSIYPGTATYNNVNLEVGSTTRTLNGGTMNVAGNFTIDDTGGTEIDSGTVNVYGNFIKSGGLNSSGSLAIKMVGTANATITTDSTYIPGATFTINKPGKTVTLASYLYLITGGSQSLALTAGSLNMAGQALMVNSMSLSSTTVTKGGGVLNVGGVEIGTGSYFGGTIAP